ncbi:hypothetical protein [Chitinophaga jiangningensis]|nr:hypothetical protein [Chitinophaga jiangningensis]
MNYVFKGRLCGLLCSDDCREPLAGVKVRLYRADARESLAVLAVADTNQTFHQVSEEDIKAKSKLLLAETIANENGEFVFNLGEKENYKGEAFDIDFTCGTGFGKPIPPKKITEFQFHLTTLQPQWRERNADNQAEYLFAWEYCIVSKWWCQILQKLDRWVICGKVVDCKTGKPLNGLRVFAYDVDLLQDDPLGSGFTDASGHFKIVYTSADFSKTLLSWLNVEWPAGPDLYFRIESGSGTVLLKEPRSMGHTSARTNAHNCFCVKLCVPDGEVYTTDTPLFTRFGEYKIIGDIDAGGLTAINRTFASGIGFGFFGSVKLVGYATKKVPTDTTRPLFYRFTYSYDGATWNPVTLAQTQQSRLVVGVREIIWNGVQAFQDIVIDPNQPASVADSIPPDGAPGVIPDHVLHQDANGWVRVDQRGIDNGFIGPLLWVNTNVLVPGGSPATPGDAPGNAPLSPKNGRRVFFAYQTTDDPANPASVHFKEQTTKGVIYVNNWEEVRLLQLDELSTGVSGCTPITTHAHVRYTADHELIASWALGIASAAVPGGITITGGSGTVPRGSNNVIDFATPGTVTPAFNTWPSCAYKLSLVTRRKLTNGEYNDDHTGTEIIFCK